MKYFCCWLTLLFNTIRVLASSYAFLNWLIPSRGDFSGSGPSCLFSVKIQYMPICSIMLIHERENLNCVVYMFWMYLSCFSRKCFVSNSTFNSQQENRGDLKVNDNPFYVNRNCAPVIQSGKSILDDPQTPDDRSKQNF